MSHDESTKNELAVHNIINEFKKHERRISLENPSEIYTPEPKEREPGESVLASFVKS